LSSPYLTLNLGAEKLLIPESVLDYRLNNLNRRVKK
jgi:hypothetical protein